MVKVHYSPTVLIVVYVIFWNFILPNKSSTTLSISYLNICNYNIVSRLFQFLSRCLSFFNKPEFPQNPHVFDQILLTNRVDLIRWQTHMILFTYCQLHDPSSKLYWQFSTRMRTPPILIRKNTWDHQNPPPICSA